MTISIEKLRQNLCANVRMPLVIIFLYSFALFILLFNTVHDRTEEEFRKRGRPLNYDSIKVWINHGYFVHGGLAFKKSAEEDPRQVVWKSLTMGYLQLAHLLQRAHVKVTGKFNYFLMALHSQFFPMLSSALLGLLAMRLSLQMKISSFHSLALGLSALTVFQTFPMNLSAVFDFYQVHVWLTFAILFLLIDNHFNWKGYDGKSKTIWILIVFLMFYIDHYITFFFMLSYGFIFLIIAPRELNIFKFLKSVVFAAVPAALIMTGQILWVKLNFPQIILDGSSLNFRTGLDGDIQYYSNHWDLLFSQYVPWLPKWKVLLFLGTSATIAVIFFNQRTKKHLDHQTTLLLGIGSFIPMAFVFSQNEVIHINIYEPLLALPLILALFALLPAWLETLNQNSGVFVLFSGLTAFAFAGGQMLAYWLHMPPYF